MNKQWLVVSPTDIHTQRDVEVRRARPEQPPQVVEAYAESARRKRKDTIVPTNINCCWLFDNEQTADDFCEELLATNPIIKLVKFEAIAVFETTPRPMKQSKWIDGKLVNVE